MTHSLPFEPLQRFGTSTELARAAGLPGELIRIRQAQHRSRVSMVLADEIAIGLGLHPVLLWGNDWLTLEPRRSTADEARVLVETILRPILKRRARIETRTCRWATAWGLRNPQ